MGSGGKKKPSDCNWVGRIRRRVAKKDSKGSGEEGLALSLVPSRRFVEAFISNFRVFSYFYLLTFMPSYCVVVYI